MEVMTVDQVIDMLAGQQASDWMKQTLILRDRQGQNPNGCSGVVRPVTDLNDRKQCVVADVVNKGFFWLAQQDDEGGLVAIGPRHTLLAGCVVFVEPLKTQSFVEALVAIAQMKEKNDAG